MKRTHSAIKNAILLVVLAAAILVSSGSACHSDRRGTADVSKDAHRAILSSGNGKMNPDDINYYPDANGRYWANNGKTFVMEGAFYNFSSEFDVVELEDCVIYLVDRTDNVVATVNVNEAAVGVIPHNGSARYNLTVNKVPGGSAAYTANELFPRLETYFNYADHKPKNCPYCHNVSVNPSASRAGSETVTHTCGWCLGEGTIQCSACKGSGKNDVYDSLSPIMKGMAKSYCEACDGKGYIVCGRCNGSGVE